MKKLLPLGSVVKVKMFEKGVITLMIIGYFPQHAETGDIYDYVTTVYPFGIRERKVIQMINHDDVLSIEFKGYQDEEAEAYSKYLPLVAAKSIEAVKLVKEGKQPSHAPGPDEAFG